ncbi:MAG: type II secretion system F family protein [Acidimicrobiales bacterium]
MSSSRAACRSRRPSPHASVFPPYYLGILRSAELTGQLDTVLDQLAIYIERDMEARSRVKSALTYPAVVGVMSVLTMVVMVAYVLPKFVDFFEELDSELPLPTRMLLGFSNIFSNYWWLFLAIIVLLVVGNMAVTRNVNARVARTRALMSLPVIGPIIQYSAVERFCRIIGAMMRAGVPLPETMAAAIESTNNAVFERELRVARDEMLEGEGVAGPLQRTDPVPAGRHPDDPGGRGDRHARPADRRRRQLLLPGDRVQAQAAHRPLRARRGHLHGRHRRLRGRGPHLGHVRRAPRRARDGNVSWSHVRARRADRRNGVVPSRLASQRGETLIEIMFTVVMLGTGFVVVLGSIFTATNISDRNAQRTKASISAQALAESLLQPANEPPAARAPRTTRSSPTPTWPAPRRPPTAPTATTSWARWTCATSGSHPLRGHHREDPVLHRHLQRVGAGVLQRRVGPDHRHQRLLRHQVHLQGRQGHQRQRPGDVRRQGHAGAHHPHRLGCPQGPSDRHAGRGQRDQRCPGTYDNADLGPC